MKYKLINAIGRNLRKPEATLLGRFVKKKVKSRQNQRLERGFVAGFDPSSRRLNEKLRLIAERGLIKNFEKKNGFIELEAVRLCAIQPNYQVLEVGFGPGIGIQAAYNIVKGGKGTIHGVDFSEEMVRIATKRMGKGISDGKVKLIHGDVSSMPFLQSNTFDRIFHCNCYYFWPDMSKAMNELHRVMKPGGVIVTAMNYERVKRIQAEGCFAKVGDPTQDRYLSALDSCGFIEVETKKIKHENTGENLVAILAKKSKI